MNAADISARVHRLDQLGRGLMKEIVQVEKADDPMLYMERLAYLTAMRQALSGIEGARVTLVKARQRLGSAGR
jgi:hypothetical protein